jgi:hypothetical protein
VVGNAGEIENLGFYVYPAYSRIEVIGLPTMRKARLSASQRMRSISSVRNSP